MAKDNLLWSDDESDTVSLTGEEEAVLNIDLEARWADDPGKYSVHVHERPDGVAHCSAVRNAPKELDLDGSRLCYGQLLLDQKPRQMATVTWMKELAAAGLPTQGLTRKDARKLDACGSWALGSGVHAWASDVTGLKAKCRVYNCH